MMKKILIFILVSLLSFTATDCKLGIKVAKVSKRFFSGKVISNTVKYSYRGGIISFLKASGKKTGKVCAEVCENKAKKFKLTKKQTIPVAKKKDVLKAARVYRKQLNWKAQYVLSDDVPSETILTQTFGKAKDGTVLFNNMKKLGVSNEIPELEQKTFNITGVSPSHHIVGGKTIYADESRKIFAKYNIDINDGRNGIVLPNGEQNFARGTIHSGSHSEEYEKMVYERIKNCSSEKELWSAIDDIKKGLFNGTIKLNNNHRVLTE